jgi:hypothetical protein
MVLFIRQVQFRKVANRMARVSLGSVCVFSYLCTTLHELTQSQIQAREITAYVGHLV